MPDRSLRSTPFLRVRYRWLDTFDVVRIVFASVFLAIWWGILAGLLAGLVLSAVMCLWATFFVNRPLRSLMDAAGRRVFPNAQPF